MQIRFLSTSLILCLLGCCGFQFAIAQTATLVANNPCATETVVFALDGAMPASDSISWQVDGAAPQQVDSVSLIVNSVREIDVQVIWTEDGETDTLSQTFMIEECPCELEMPNVFTPNQDKPNDVNSTLGAMFNSHCDNRFISHQLLIYSRWGELIFDSCATQSMPCQIPIKWDGTRNGKDAPADTYIYVLNYELNDIEGSSITHDPITLKGEVLLLR